ncbi:MAG: hypothetical protein H6867_05655 [Rhodospirillales bacterium]|nr:hypothetical protein [Rhodospirillales bacterium]MCB9995014.1 hypothetical protein [Rhodospirillales bacterium]
MTIEKTHILIDGSGSFSYPGHSQGEKKRSHLGYALEAAQSLTLKAKGTPTKPVHVMVWGDENIPHIKFDSTMDPFVNRVLAAGLEAVNGLQCSTNPVKAIKDATTQGGLCKHIIIISDGELAPSIQQKTTEALESFLRFNPGSEVSCVIVPSNYGQKPENTELVKIAEELAAKGAQNIRAVICPAEQLKPLLNDIAEGKYKPAPAAQDTDDLTTLRKAFEEMGKKLEVLEKKQRAKEQIAAGLHKLSPSGFDKK